MESREEGGGRREEARGKVQRRIPQSPATFNHSRETGNWKRATHEALVLRAVRIRPSPERSFRATTRPVPPAGTAGGFVWARRVSITSATRAKIASALVTDSSRSA